MRKLILDLLAGCRILSNDQEEIELVELNQVCQEAVENFGSSIRESGALVRSGLPIVYGHRAHFLQLFQNLIGNAIKYRSGERLPEVFVSSARDGDDWLLCVSDNGIGMAPEYHDSIFGVFKRLHGKESSGTGIGLAICKRVAERYGGRIWVESIALKGAAFYYDSCRESDGGAGSLSGLSPHPAFPAGIPWRLFGPTHSCSRGGTGAQRVAVSRYGNGTAKPTKTWSNTMRIAQVAPLHETVPPKLYGGTERVRGSGSQGIRSAGFERNPLAVHVTESGAGTHLR
jgi:hypothetical protein